MAAPTTALDICRKALRVLHSLDPLADDALTNPSGKAATLCSEFYDDSRREVLRLAPWTCIAKRLALTSSGWAASRVRALGDLIYKDGGVFKCTTAGTSGATAATWPASAGTITDGTAVWTFQYAIIGTPGDNYTGYKYAYPLPEDYINIIDLIDSQGATRKRYMEKGILYTDESAPILHYVPNSEDVALWDPLLASAMVYYLASKIGYPLQGDQTDASTAAQAFSGAVNEAIGKTKREKQQGSKPADSWYPGLFEDKR
jgi:hypothetical protein